jgi:hypothetical protein
LLAELSQERSDVGFEPQVELMKLKFQKRSALKLAENETQASETK